MSDKELMQQALEALESIESPLCVREINLVGAAMNALRQRLARSEQEPLTDEEIADLWDGHVVPVFGKNGINPIVFARTVERAHGIGSEV